MRDVNICLEQFEKFYNLLMSNAPEGYVSWLFTCEKNGKNPIEGISWKSDKARLTKEQAIERIKQGYNIGISARKDDGLAIIDIDNPNYLNQAPKNTLTCISRKRVGSHSYCWAKDNSIKINLPTDDGEIRSDNQYLLAPGSYVPFDLTKEKDRKDYAELPEEVKQDKYFQYYTVKLEIPPRPITFDDVPQFFKDYKKQKDEAESIAKERCKLQESYKPIYSNSKVVKRKYDDLLNLKVSDIVGYISKHKRVGHPLHDSDTNANFSLSSDGCLATCWRHLVTLNAVQFLCVQAGYTSCGMAGTPHKGGISTIKGDKKALEVAYQEAVRIGLIKEFVSEKKEEEMQPRGWALSINIKSMAERYNLLNCWICNLPFNFNEKLGQYKCSSCGTYGGLKRFAEAIQNLKLKETAQ